MNGYNLAKSVDSPHRHEYNQRRKVYSMMTELVVISIRYDTTYQNRVGNNKLLSLLIM